MGMQLMVHESGPADVAKAASEMGMPLRMVDNMPAFPDEAVPEAFQEIRLGAEGGMISIRHSPAGLVLVVWGNADTNLQQSLTKLAVRLAGLSSGKLQAAGKVWQADEWLAAGAPLVDS